MNFKVTGNILESFYNWIKSLDTSWLVGVSILEHFDDFHALLLEEDHRFPLCEPLQEQAATKVTMNYTHIL
jgi:hypothetical protein